MRFEWDERKNQAKQQKHGISFEASIRVFDDPASMVLFDRHVSGEDRFWIVGCAENTAVLVVVHTYRQAKGGLLTRIISARKASRRERRAYEEANG